MFDQVTFDMALEGKYPHVAGIAVKSNSYVAPSVARLSPPPAAKPAKGPSKGFS